MPDQLPTPIIEILMLSILMGSVTFIGMAVLYAWLLRRKKLFRWGIFICSQTLTLLVGNLLATYLWAAWPFTFDILFGPVFWPGLAAYGLINMIELGVVYLCYFNPAK